MTQKLNVNNTYSDTLDRRPAGNKVLPKWRQKCYYETFVLSSTAVILLNFSAKNPRHFGNTQTVSTQFNCRIEQPSKREEERSQIPKDSQRYQDEEGLTGERRRRGRNSFIKAEPPLTGKLE